MALENILLLSQYFLVCQAGEKGHNDSANNFTCLEKSFILSLNRNFNLKLWKVNILEENHLIFYFNYDLGWPKTIYLILE